MRIWTVYDPGTAEPLEDRLINNFPYVGVIDGMSGPNRSFRFKGRSGGEAVGDLILEGFLAAPLWQVPLEEVIFRVNRTVSRFQLDHGGDLKRAETLLGGAVLAVAELGREEVHLLTIGDCLALWKMKGGEAGITHNQVFPRDIEDNRIKAELMRKHQGDRVKLEEEYAPIRTQMVLECVNKKWGVLNGQPELQSSLQSYTLWQDDLKLLLFFTDGAICYPENYGDRIAFANNLLDLYNDGGLKAIVDARRDQEAAGKMPREVYHAEATTIAIEF